MLYERRMPRIERTYNRDELYAQVWAKTIRDVAKDYGVSDVALKKICRKLNVPTPPQGYWLRDPAARDVVRPKLPPGGSQKFVSVVWHDHEHDSTPAATERAEIERSADRIDVPLTLEGPHRLVAKTFKILTKNKP